jgi:F0F1-type ATP synthase membrane subunit c/vacuolar-type H+-ATPase subunit K
MNRNIIIYPQLLYISQQVWGISMDWIAIIILGLGIPIIGGIIGVFMVARKYAQIKENPHEFGLSFDEDISKNLGKYVVLQSLHVPGIIYGVLVIQLFWVSSRDLNVSQDQLSTLGVTLALVVGIPVFFANISRGLILRNGFEALVKDPKDFGRVILHGVVPEVPMIFGLLFAILSLSFSGLLEMEYWMTQDQIDGLFNAALVFSALSSGILISGFLLNRMENPFEMSNFSRSVLANSTGIFIPIIGLIYYILKFLDMGLFLNGP